MPGLAAYAKLDKKWQDQVIFIAQKWEPVSYYK